MADNFVMPYNPEWAIEFKQIGATLREHFDDIALRIDHVSNTSLVGGWAKDVLDIQMSVATLELGDDVAKRFDDLGYIMNKIRKESAPLGAPDPETYVSRMVTEKPGDRAVHVHIRVSGAANERQTLLFREYMRANPDALGTYGQIMEELARYEREGVKDVYKTIKVAATDLVGQSAELWAEQTNWQYPPSDF